jgi:pyridoxamine 5'-phosphate oxidase
MTLWDPPVGFDQPLAALRACHRRIEKQLATLTSLQRHVAKSGCDAEARAAAEAILKYFMEAAPKHHADEEADLFPRVLRAAEGLGNRANAFELVAHLLVEHRDMEDIWVRVQAELEALLSGEAQTLDAQLCRDFAHIYADHIGREEKQLFPLAEKLLTANDWVALGSSMALRRGLPASSFAPAG